MTSIRKKIWATCLTVGLVAVACSSGDGAASTTQEDAAAGSTGQSDTDAPDTNTPSGGENATSEGFDELPVGIPDGWEIDILGEIGFISTDGAQLLYPADDFENVVAFYDQWTADQPEEYAKTETEDQVIYSRMVSPTYFITVSRGHEERGELYTHLLVAAPQE